MPITRRQFELGIDFGILQWMEKIHAFLSAHKAEAFTRSELAVTLGISAQRMFELKRQAEDFDLALEKLTEVGAVEARRIKDILYYSYHSPLNT